MELFNLVLDVYFSNRNVYLLRSLIFKELQTDNINSINLTNAMHYVFDKQSENLINYTGDSANLAERVTVDLNNDTVEYYISVFQNNPPDVAPIQLDHTHSDHVTQIPVELEQQLEQKLDQKLKQYLEKYVEEIAQITNRIDIVESTKSNIVNRISNLESGQGRVEKLIKTYEDVNNRLNACEQYISKLKKGTAYIFSGGDLLLQNVNCTILSKYRNKSQYPQATHFQIAFDTISNIKTMQINNLSLDSRRFFNITEYNNTLILHENEIAVEIDLPKGFYTLSDFIHVFSQVLTDGSTQESCKYNVSFDKLHKLSISAVATSKGSVPKSTPNRKFGLTFTSALNEILGFSYSNYSDACSYSAENVCRLPERQEIQLYLQLDDQFNSNFSNTNFKYFCKIAVLDGKVEPIDPNKIIFKSPINLSSLQLHLKTDPHTYVDYDGEICIDFHFSTTQS